MSKSLCSGVPLSKVRQPHMTLACDFTAGLDRWAQNSGAGTNMPDFTQKSDRVYRHTTPMQWGSQELTWRSLSCFLLLWEHPRCFLGVQETLRPKLTSAVSGHPWPRRCNPQWEKRRKSEYVPSLRCPPPSLLLWGNRREQRWLWLEEQRRAFKADTASETRNVHTLT